LLKQVREIEWSEAIQTFICQKENLKINSIVQREPMKSRRNWRKYGDLPVKGFERFLQLTEVEDAYRETKIRNVFSLFPEAVNV